MKMKKIIRVYHYLRCIPKTLLFNFYYFSFKDAIRFPVIISHKTAFLSLDGKVLLPKNAKTAKIKLGFGRVQVADSKYSRFIWNVEKDATITFGHNVRIGTGSRLDISGDLSFGDGCNFSGESSIVCKKAIRFGQSCLISWQTLFMDSDLHKITDQSGMQTNQNKAIEIGDKVWVCARATVLKGVSVGNNSVVSCGAVVVHSSLGNATLGGDPASKVGDFKNKTFQF